MRRFCGQCGRAVGVIAVAGGRKADVELCPIHYREGADGVQLLTAGGRRVTGIPCAPAYREGTGYARHRCMTGGKEQ